jgi:hypothetical protein
LYYQQNNIIIVFYTLECENSIPYRMKYIVCALAMVVLAGSSCKSKSEPETKPVPEVVKENPVPGAHPNEPSENHHHEEGKGHKHGKGKWIPPGHAKKMHGDKSARNYAPGHSR